MRRSSKLESNYESVNPKFATISNYMEREERPAMLPPPIMRSMVKKSPRYSESSAV